MAVGIKCNDGKTKQNIFIGNMMQFIFPMFKQQNTNNR